MQTRRNYVAARKLTIGASRTLVRVTCLRTGTQVEMPLLMYCELSAEELEDTLVDVVSGGPKESFVTWWLGHV